ncbi:unnamed protein product, partial [Iphiclides podalirius]
MPSVNTCCVPGCSEMSASTRILHSFPNPMKDHKRFHTWISNIGAPELAGLTNETIYKCRRVCHAHFERKYWCRYERISKVAIPTLNILHIEDKYNPDVALKSGEAPSFSSFNTREMALCESQLDSALPQIKREVSSPCSEGEVSPEKKPKLEPNGDVYGLKKVFKMGKTNAEKCKSYYYRKKAAKEAEKIRQGLSVKRPTRKTGAERTRACRLRKRMTGILSVPSTSNPPPASVVTNRPDVSTVSSNGVADHDVDTREMALCESQLDSALPQIKREVSSPCSEHRMSPEPNEDIYGLKKVSTTEMALCESQLDSALPRIKREVPSPEESRLSPEMKPKLEPNGDVYGLNKVDTGEMALCESQLDSALPQIKREVSSPCSEDRMSPEPNEDIYGLNKDPPTTSILGSRSQLSPIDNTTINTPSTSKVSEMPSRNAVKCKNYRNRKKSANVKIKKPLTSAERSRMYRLRKKQLAQGIKSSLNEVCTPPTFNSLMTSEQSPQPVTKESESDQPAAKKAKSHYDTLSSHQ